MRFPILALTAATALATPLAADPLRIAASEFFGPLPASVTELDGHVATPEKAELGKKLFFDTRLSASGTQSCASCHDLAKAGTDGLPTALMADGKPGLRNTLTVLNAVLNTDHYWDGREADLAIQTTGPELAGLGMMNTPDAALAAVKAIPGYAEEFALAFPGEADPVTVENLGRALESFEATLLTPAPFDAWLSGDDAALGDDQKAGLQLFLDKGCAYCHFGPSIGGQGYYPLGLVELPGIDIKAEDEVAQAAAADPKAEDFIFRTASLRNIALTAPYFHSGKVTDLSVAVDVMAAGQLGSPLGPEETASIVAFLQSLTGTMPEIAPPTLP